MTAGVIFFRGQHRRLREEAVTSLESIAALKTAQLVEWRRERLEDAAAAMEHPVTLRLVREWLEGKNRNTEKELASLFEIQKKYHGYLEVRLFDAAGAPLFQTRKEAESLHQEISEGLAQAHAVRRPVLTEFHEDPAGLGLHLGAVVPVFASGTADAPLLGAVVFSIDPNEFFYPLIQTWPTPSPSAETLLVSRDGDEALFLNELRHRRGTALRLRIPVDQDTIPATMAVQGREGVVEGRDYRGTPVLAVISKIPGSPWFLIAKIDRTEAFAGWRFRAGLILALILSLIAASAAAFLMLWQRQAKAHFRALHKADLARELSEARYRTTLFSIGDGVIVTDAAGRIDFLNPAAEHMTGWTEGEARGRPVDEVFSIVNEENRRPADNPVARILREGLIVGLANHTLLLSRDGREIPIADSGAPIHKENGLIGGVVLVFSDQTAERRVEREMKRNVTRLRTLVEILQHPAESVQDYLDFALSEAVRLTGSKLGYIYHYHEDRKQFILNTWSREVMKECTILNPATVYDLDKTGIWGEAVRRRRPIIVNDFAAPHPLKKGYPEGHAPLHKYMTIPVFKDQEIAAVVGVANKESDYTDEDVLQLSILMESAWRVVERIGAEEALRESEKKFQSVFEASNVGKSLTQPTGEVRPNEALCRMLGYAEAELTAMKWQDMTPIEDIEAVESVLRPFYSGEAESARFEKRYVRKDGSILWGDVSVAARRDAEGRLVHFITSVIDITARKEAERRLEGLTSRQTAMLSAIPDIIMEVDADKRYVWANAAGLVFFGPDVIGREAAEYFEGGQTTYETVEPLFKGQEDVIYVESWQRRRDGQKRLLAWWCRVLKNARGEVAGALSTARDITGQKEAEEKLRLALKEREVMLREIHHRVKNNIQIVASLLRLQSRRTEDARAREALIDSQNRIRSMALIHEKLYQTNDFSCIALEGYFQNMGSHLLTVFRETAGEVRLAVDARDVALDINRAIPLGLIVNELLTNALKHAFSGRRDGEILIRLVRRPEGAHILTVKDNGIGFPDSHAGPKGDSLGLEIVRDLVGQIDGSLEIRNDAGAEITIRF